MKKPVVLIMVFILILSLTSIACGGSSDIEVSTPVSEEELAVGAQEVVPTEAPTEIPTEVPTEVPPVGTRRDNPAPAGYQVRADDMVFIANSVTRPATSIVLAANMFNSEPEPNLEYMFIDLTVMCEKDTTEQCSLSTYNFKVVGSAGIERDLELFVTGVDGLLESSDFYGASGVRGYLPFIVGVDETDVLLVYEPVFGDPFYMALP